MTAVEIVGLRARVRDRVHRYHDVHDLTGLLRRSLPELREISCVEGPVDGRDPAEQIFLRSWGLPHLTRLACRDVALLRYLSCPELLCPMASQHVCLPLLRCQIDGMQGVLGHAQERASSPNLQYSVVVSRGRP